MLPAERIEAPEDSPFEESERLYRALRAGQWQEGFDGGPPAVVPEKLDIAPGMSVDRSSKTDHLDLLKRHGECLVASLAVAELPEESFDGAALFLLALPELDNLAHCHIELRSLASGLVCVGKGADRRARTYFRAKLAVLLNAGIESLLPPRNST